MTATKLDTTYISKGNSKTGDAASFDLPAINTCPGATFGEGGCANDCYADRLMRIYKNVAAKYARNLQFAESDEFVNYMIANLPSGTNRVHVSGDFYSPDYVWNWIRIISARPDAKFYAYTRSWQLPHMRDALLTLAKLENMTLNASVDDLTGKPTQHFNHLMWCYLSHNDDGPNWLRPTDLVFRSNHNGHKRRRKNAIKKGNTPPALVSRINGTRVCPLERGSEKDLPINCSTCRICM
jgi:hypothetical protein